MGKTAYAGVAPEEGEDVDDAESEVEAGTR